MGWEAKGWTETHTGKIRVDRNLEHFLCTKHCSKSSLCVSSCEPHKDPMKEDDYYSHLKDEGTEAREAIWWRLQTWKEGANYLPTATSSRISPSLSEVGLCGPPLITDFLWGMQQQGLGGDRKAGSREEGTSLLFLSCSCFFPAPVGGAQQWLLTPAIKSLGHLRTSLWGTSSSQGALSTQRFGHQIFWTPGSGNSSLLPSQS